MTRAPKPMYTNQTWGTTAELNERLEEVDSKEITGRNTNVMYAPPGNNQNFEAPPEEITQEQAAEIVANQGGQENILAIDRITERPDENINTGIADIPANAVIQNAEGFPVMRPGTEYKNSDLAAAWVKSGFNDDILNILIRMT